MARARSTFRSGNYISTSNTLAHGSYSWLLSNLQERELGCCGDALYLKLGGTLVLLKGGDASVDKVADYLYRKSYSFYEDYKDVEMRSVASGCSSFRIGNTMGRNLDWYYSYQADFVVTCERIGAYRSIGVASHPGITKSMAESGEYTPFYAELPWYTQDGINEKGLYINHNVVPDDIEGGLTDAIPTGRVDVVLDGRQVTRYVLDNYASVHEAVEHICKHVKIVCNRDLVDKGYGVHYMLADGTDTVVLEIVGGRLHVIEADAMTNFWLYGTRLNEDGTVYTNADAPTHKATVENGITPHGAGLERWNIIQQYRNEGGTDVRTLLNSLLYSRTYTDAEWFSEMVGSYGITVDTPADDSVMQQVVAGAKVLYENRTREEPSTWHTTHSCVYDLDALTLSVVVQEDGDNMYSFAL